MSLSTVLILTLRSLMHRRSVRRSNLKTSYEQPFGLPAPPFTVREQRGLHAGPGWGLGDRLPLLAENFHSFFLKLHDNAPPLRSRIRPWVPPQLTPQARPATPRCGR